MVSLRLYKNCIRELHCLRKSQAKLAMDFLPSQVNSIRRMEELQTLQIRIYHPKNAVKIGFA